MLLAALTICKLFALPQYRLFSLIPVTQANITTRDPREASLIKMERYLTGDLKRGNRSVRHGLENSPLAKSLLKIIGVLAVSMVMSGKAFLPNNPNLIANLFIDGIVNSL